MRFQRLTKSLMFALAVGFAAGAPAFAAPADGRTRPAHAVRFVNAAQAGSSWRTIDVAGRPGPADLGAAPGAAAGAGPRDWWAKHGPEITAALGCMLSGAAAAQLFLVGVSGVGGVLAMLGLIEGGLNCFN